jgi:hypothetical protein
MRQFKSQRAEHAEDGIGEMAAGADVGVALVARAYFGFIFRCPDRARVTMRWVRSARTGTLDGVGAASSIVVGGARAESVDAAAPADGTYRDDGDVEPALGESWSGGVAVADGAGGA